MFKEALVLRRSLRLLPYAITTIFTLISILPIHVESQLSPRFKNQRLTEKSAPNGPGFNGSSPRPDKQGVGTTLNRKIWFTINNGVVTEIMYPRIDLAQTRDTILLLQLDGGFLDERAINYQVTRVPGTLAYELKGAFQGGRIEKTIMADTNSDSIIIDYNIQFTSYRDKKLILLHNSTAQGTSGGDAVVVKRLNSQQVGLHMYQIDVRGDEPAALSQPIHQLVTWDLPNTQATVGFVGVNAPYDQLRSQSFPADYDSAAYGNVAGALIHQTQQSRVSFRTVVSFSSFGRFDDLQRQASTALRGSRNTIISQQKSEWSNYLRPLDYDKSDLLSEASILVLKGLEDKEHPGAIIAAPGNPGIPWIAEAGEHDYEKSRLRIGDSNGGYRRVWPRDLYHKGIAFLAVKDNATAIDIARWFKKTQLRTSMLPGTWAQNMWADGTPSWQGFQIDQAAFPIVLISRLVELRLVSYAEFRDMVQHAADSIITNGPATGQERWEENGGLSPNSFAAAIQGLLAASWLERSSSRGAKYQQVAYEWLSNLNEWLLIQNGYFGSGYYARLELGDGNNWNPSQHRHYYIANKRPGQNASYREDQILDGGFLEFILSGLVNPHAQEFNNTISLYDRYIRKNTHAGVGYIRYNEDSYGENHYGGAWPLLSAERAIAAIERGESYQEHLEFIRRMKTSADMIGEQDTLAVRPLAWSHGSYLILKKSIKQSKSFYIPGYRKAKGSKF